MYDLTIDGLLENGFSRKMAIYFYELLEKERKSGVWTEEELKWAHERGFLAESVVAYGLREKQDTHKYLSDYDYFRIWPLNDWERIWINDKLTLKYVLSDTVFDKYMPRYFYYKTYDRLVPLMNCEEKYRNSTVKELVSLLIKEKKIACKPCNGSLSVGFFQISYEDGNIYINGEQYNVEELEQFIENHPNYVYTEFFVPSKDMAEIFPLIHTIRVLVIKPGAQKPKVKGAYLRFGTKGSGYANFMNSTVDVKFVYDVDINVETGEYDEGKAVYVEKVQDMPCHPDTNVLVKGKFELWEEAKNMVLELTEYLQLCEYMGFDICFTDKGIKIMEINSHSGIKHLQMRKPFLEDEWSRDYFNGKIERINELSQAEKKKRNGIMR